VACSSARPSAGLFHSPIYSQQFNAQCWNAAAVGVSDKCLAYVHSSTTAVVLVCICLIACRQETIIDWH